MEKLAEMFRYSDPVTCDETAETEEQLAVELAELKEALDETGAEDLLKKIENIKNQLNERNRICKMSK